MAARAKELADLCLDVLRMRIGTCDLPSQNIRENRHRSRGDLIEELLTDEFESKALAIDEKER